MGSGAGALLSPQPLPASAPGGTSGERVARSRRHARISPRFCGQAGGSRDAFSAPSDPQIVPVLCRRLGAGGLVEFAWGSALRLGHGHCSAWDWDGGYLWRNPGAMALRNALGGTGGEHRHSSAPHPGAPGVSVSRCPAEALDIFPKELRLSTPPAVLLALPGNVLAPCTVLRARLGAPSCALKQRLSPVSSCYPLHGGWDGIPLPAGRILLKSSCC